MGWTTDRPDVVRLSVASNATCTVTAAAPGTAIVTAKRDALEGAFTITVEDGRAIEDGGGAADADADRDVDADTDADATDAESAEGGDS